jgi:hypothetical protein
VPLGREVIAQQHRDVAVVFDDEDACHDYTPTGSTMLNVLPSPGALSTRSEPP